MPVHTPLEKSRSWAWIVLVIALGLQALLFRQFCQREVLPAFPRAFDQTDYLGIAYDLHEKIRNDGLWAGTASIPTINSPQGILLQVEGALAQFLEGPGRLAPLEVTFAHLALFQIALFALGVSLGRPSLGLALCGVLLATSSPYNEVGGMQDFRLDFPAFCHFGILICIAMRSAFFRHRRWSELFGVWVAVLVLTRTITLAYLIPGLGALTVLLFVLAKMRVAEGRVRVRHLLVAGGLAIVIGVPSVLLRWEHIYRYYGTHRAGTDATLRSMDLGILTSLDHLYFYAHSAVAAHAGRAALVLAALVVIALLVPGRDRGEAPNRALTKTDSRIGLAWVIVTVVATYFVLTADESKSPVVGGIFVAMAIPTIALLPGLFSSAGEGTWRQTLLLLVFVAGMAIFASHTMRRGSINVDGPDMRDYAAMIDRLSRLCQQFDITAPVISTDQLAEFTHPGVLKVMAFERFRLQMKPTYGLGAIKVGFPAVTQEEADHEIARSDFALIGVDRDPTVVELFPVNTSLRQLAPHVFDKASREMVRLEDFTFFGRHLTLFVRPAVRCTGQTPTWVAGADVNCDTVGVVTGIRPIVRLTGQGAVGPHGLPAVTARIVRGVTTVASVPCQMTIKQGSTPTALQPYAVTCDLRASNAGPGEPAMVAISFTRVDPPPQLLLSWPSAEVEQFDTLQK